MTSLCPVDARAGEWWIVVDGRLLRPVALCVADRKGRGIAEPLYEVDGELLPLGDLEPESAWYQGGGAPEKTERPAAGPVRRPAAREPPF